MKTAFSYHRYSTELQRDSYTLEAQRRITKEIAAKYEASIIQIYEDEAISGATIEKRPSMLQLLEDLPKLKPDYLIATNQDRIARGNDFWAIKNLLVKTKTSIITEKEGIIDQSDITKDALSDMLAVFAKLERALIGQRISRGLTQKSHQGLWHTGIAPLGYSIVKSNLVKNPEQAILVRKIFDLAANGMTSISIANLLNRSSHNTSKNKKFTHTSIIRILTNLTYIGKVKNFNETFDGIHEPLIDIELFEKANQNIRIRSIKSTTRPMQYLLSGFLYCGKCGGKLYGMRKFYRKRRNGIMLEYYHGYKCVAIPKDYCGLRITGKIDSFVMDLIRVRIKKMKLRIKNSLVKTKNIKNDKNYYQRDLEEIDGKISRLVGGYVDGIIPIDEYKKRNEELKNARISLQKEIENYSDDSTDIYYYIQNSGVLELFDELDYLGKRDLVNMFIYKIIVDPAITYNKQGYKVRLQIFWKVDV